MSVSTSLSLRALLKGAISRSGMGLPAKAYAGLTPGASALFVAHCAHDLQDGVVLFVVPNERQVEQATTDVRFFLEVLEGASTSALDRAVLSFPSPMGDPYRGLPAHLRIASARARALSGMLSGGGRVIVASATALLPRLSAPERLLIASTDLRPGMDIAPSALADLLVDAGFTREDPVDEHGEFCLRGGILDIFPAGEPYPVRLEFLGDTIETIRVFDPSTQRSLSSLDQLAIVPLRELFEDEPAASHPGHQEHEEERAEGNDAGRTDLDRSATIFDYLAAARRSSVVVAEPDEVRLQAEKYLTQIAASYADVSAKRQVVPPPEALFVEWPAVQGRLQNAVSLEQLEVGETPEPETPRPVHDRGARGTRHVASQPSMEYRGRLAEWVAEIERARTRGEQVLFVACTPGRAERTVELLAEYGIRATPAEEQDAPLGAAVLVATGELSRGFRLPAAGFQVFAEGDIFEEERRATERRRSIAGTFLSDLRDLKVGDLVVHVDHGIGVFVGLKQLGVGRAGDAPQEFLELRYAGEDKLFVPVERLDLIQKYTGASRPPLDRLGGTSWERAKTKVKKAMRDMAEELLKLYAARRAMPGHAFGPDTHWQREFEDAFAFDLTPDQQSAIRDIRHDMEQASPMDRLLCGDVGYGKTEVAMRAAFKAVMDGKQVAFLAPTTVLAFQHLKTLGDRFAGFPVQIDMVSRFRSKAEQKATLENLAAGKLDIIVGTHRLLSKDVVFRDLGLLIVDEEQRFGVAHKEKIKQLRRKVDVLTMTATPIPRTLNMSLVGIRDMSIIETPPKDRLSIQTNVVKFDQQVISQAIRNELARGGQVYFVHNRVESIYSIGNLVTRLVPEARVGIGHGQMAEDELEKTMLDFVSKKFDVLLATTIVENGLDIPNANTIIINRADRYGLSQLYQLRGRVGRSDRPAYAYLLIPPETTLSPVAKKRLAAIKEFSDLGSGFRVAALDLEIRGAGNLLGGEQSGHIETIGFEMYMKLLEQTVRELKGEELEDEHRAAVNLQADLRIDADYIPDMNQRLMVYRKVATSRTEAEIDRVLEETRDRYGPVPPSLLNLADYGRIRVLADRVGLEAVDREGSAVVFKFRAQAKVEPERLVSIVRTRPEVRLIPPSALRLELRGAQVQPSVPAPAVRMAPPPPSGGRPPLMGKGLRKPARPTDPASWWTTRATSGEVAPGFTRDAILKAVPEDPRGDGGVFMRVTDLLRQLLGER